MRKLVITAVVVWMTSVFCICVHAQNPCDARVAGGKLFIPCLYLGGNTYELNITINDNLINGVSDTGPSTAAPAPVAKSGQTDSYGMGDDGDLEGGVDWPNPRFTDNGNGSVTDNLTGLVWLKNANCFGARTVEEALNDCNALVSGGCGLTDGSSAGDWHLPNRKEMDSLIHSGFVIPALSNTAGTGQWTDGDAFTGVQSSYYWASTTYAYATSHEWFVDLTDGVISYNSKTTTAYVWPVRK